MKQAEADVGQLGSHRWLCVHLRFCTHKIRKDLEAKLLWNLEDDFSVFVHDRLQMFNISSVLYLARHCQLVPHPLSRLPRNNHRWTFFENCLLNSNLAQLHLLKLQAGKCSSTTSLVSPESVLEERESSTPPSLKEGEVINAALLCETQDTTVENAIDVLSRQALHKQKTHVSTKHSKHCKHCAEAVCFFYIVPHCARS